MRRVCAAVFWSYPLGCALAFGLVPATGAGLFGLGPNPFAALPAVIFSLPWSFLSSLLTYDLSMGASLALIAIGMAIDAALLWLLWRVR
jgi:hypothetical protein